MRITDFQAKFRYLYHVTDKRNLPGICRRGLLPTVTLLKELGIDKPTIDEITTAARPRDRAVKDSTGETFIITNNKPLLGSILSSVLVDMTAEQWLHSLNSRVFFWPEAFRMNATLIARSKNSPCCLLKLDANKLAERYYSCMEFSPINTGSVRSTNQRRGSRTFIPAVEYTPNSWRGLHRSNVIQEVSILSDVYPIQHFLVGVDEV